MTGDAPSDSAPRTIALVGLMGAGKSSIGWRLAKALGLPFHDADAEIEKAAGRTVSDIFAERGEEEFRRGERQVIARLLAGPPHVLATGGGAFMNEETRALLKAKAVTAWLKADLDTLVRRVSRRRTRPLLVDKDPGEVLRGHMEQRYPVYAEADIVIDAGGGTHETAVQSILTALKQRSEAA